MKKVYEYIKEKMIDSSLTPSEYGLIKEKAKVVAKIIKYRNKHNLTQAQLAKRLRVKQQYISKIEEGDFHNIESIDELLHKMGYTLGLSVKPYLGLDKWALVKDAGGFRQSYLASRFKRKKR